jgi:hypothetical protein
MNKRSDKRKLLGAVAAMSYKNGTDIFALKAGLYVFMQSDENAHLLELPPDWKPKELRYTHNV